LSTRNVTAGSGLVATETGNQTVLSVDTAVLPLVSTYTATFTGQTTVTIYGSTHGIGTANLLVQCWDASLIAQAVEPDTVTVGAGYDVVVTFAVPQSGKCVVRR
jgi:hypothetical protein